MRLHDLSMIEGGWQRNARVLIALLWLWLALSGATAVSGTTDGTGDTSNRYLAHIFNKYGSRGTIGFEGLEHLMHSLRLGGVEFRHTVAEHRTKDFRLPEMVLNVTHEHEHDGRADEVETTATTERPANGGALGSDVAVDGATVVTDDMWLDNVEIHDSRHRHPRHNGECDGSEGFNTICMYFFSQFDNFMLLPEVFYQLLPLNHFLYNEPNYKK